MPLFQLALLCALVVGADGQPSPQAPTRDPKWSVDLSIGVNRSAGATWWEVMPSATYLMTERWSVEVGAPLYVVNGELSGDGRSHTGIGDVYGSVSVDLSRDAVTFYSTLSASAATGSASKGLGAGQATWDWTSHVGKDVGRVTPYGDVGFSNGLDYLTRIGNNRAAGLSGAVSPSSGNLFNGEAGVEVTVSEAVSLSVSGYVTRPLGAQTVVRVIPPRRPGQPGRVVTVANENRDAGASTTLSATVARGADLSVWFWRSTTFRYNTASVSVTLKLAELFRGK